jgi:hypothetical protein
MTSFYRFRSVDALLGERQELEKQEIYFSPLPALNDPIDGFRDLLWQGDEIVWRNLLRHYLRRLTQTVSYALIVGKDYVPSILKRFVLGTERSFPNFIELHQRVCAAFFDAYELNTLPQLLAACPHPFRRDDLEFCLRAVHASAFNTIINIFRDRKMLPPSNVATPPPEIAEESVVKSLKHVLASIAAGDVSPEEQHALFIAAGHLHKQLDLIIYLGNSGEESRAWHSIFYSFPEQYVGHLKDLVFSDWYAACFVADPNHSAMWGNYGDGHKGVCLKFRAEDVAGGLPIIKLRGMIGIHGGPDGSGKTYGDRQFQFEKMTYVDKFDSIDCFRSMGRVQVRALRAEWYTDESGKISPCAEGVFDVGGEWQRNYWASFQNVATTKLRDWRHEDEHRLVLTSSLELFPDENDRKFVYKFSDLEGIIFGISTPLEAKERIINIIREKCKKEGRTEFAFSQATFVPHAGKIVNQPLELIRFA